MFFLLVCSTVWYIQVEKQFEEIIEIESVFMPSSIKDFKLFNAGGLGSILEISYEWKGIFYSSPKFSENEGVQHAYMVQENSTEYVLDMDNGFHGIYCDEGRIFEVWGYIEKDFVYYYAEDRDYSRIFYRSDFEILDDRIVISREFSLEAFIFALISLSVVIIVFFYQEEKKV